MIPLILGAVALGSAAFGAMKGSEGIGNMNTAKEIGERARKRHEDAINQLKADWETANKAAEEYGQLQLDVMMHTIGRFVDFIERNIGKAKQSDKEFLEGLDGISVSIVSNYKQVAEQEQTKRRESKLGRLQHTWVQLPQPGASIKKLNSRSGRSGKILKNGRKSQLPRLIRHETN